MDFRSLVLPAKDVHCPFFPIYPTLLYGRCTRCRWALCVPLRKLGVQRIAGVRQSTGMYTIIIFLIRKSLWIHYGFIMESLWNHWKFRLVPKVEHTVKSLEKSSGTLSPKKESNVYKQSKRLGI